MNIKVTLELDDITKIELTEDQLRQLFDFLQRLFMNEHNYNKVLPGPWTVTYPSNASYGELPTYNFVPTKVPPLPPKNKRVTTLTDEDILELKSRTNGNHDRME